MILTALGRALKCRFGRWRSLIGLAVLLNWVPAVSVAAPPARIDTFEVKVGTQEDKFSTAEILALFEASEDKVYSLGPGDVLSVEVWDRAELSGTHVIGPDGQISLPVAGDLRLGGLDRERAAEAVKRALAAYYLDPVVTLRIDQYVSNHIYVLGRVSNPGLISFEETPTLLGAITRAGGLPVGGVGADKASLTRCAVFRGKDRVVWIDLSNLLTGDMALNIRLQKNDLVYIPDSNDQLVYVLGAVNHPGAFNLTPEMSFMDALALAGGPAEGASLSRMKVIRSGRELRRKVSLEKILKPRAGLNVLLQENDIVFVPKSGLEQFSYLTSKLNPITSLMLVGTAFLQITKP